MGNPTTIITHNQRVIDQLALENLNNLKSEKVQSKIQSKKRLVIGYLQRKLTHVAIDDSVIDRMDKDEFNRIFKKAKVRHYLVFACTTSWFLLSIFGIIWGFILALNMDLELLGTLITAVSIVSIFVSTYVCDF